MGMNSVTTTPSHQPILKNKTSTHFTFQDLIYTPQKYFPIFNGLSVYLHIYNRIWFSLHKLKTKVC